MIAMYICRGDGRYGVLAIPQESLHALMMTMRQPFPRRPHPFPPHGAVVIAPNGMSVPRNPFGHVSDEAVIDFSSGTIARKMMLEARRLLRYDPRAGVVIVPVSGLWYETSGPRAVRYRAKTNLGEFVTENL